MVDIAKINGIAVADIAKYNGVATTGIGKVTGVTWPHGPTTIGEAYGGGYYAGQISTTADGIATHYLIVSPKATGEIGDGVDVPETAWSTATGTTGATSVIDGPGNTATLVGLGAAYKAANFCNGLTIGGYEDWYLPAKNELEVCYYFLKPGTTVNNTSSGYNANAVSPEPISTLHTTSDPAQTSVTDFRLSGGTNQFKASAYWSSTEATSLNANRQSFDNGYQGNSSKGITNFYVRAVRRVAI